VPIRKSWYEDFRSELLAFPTARHDDQVDALGLIGQLLDKMIVGKRAKPQTERQEWGYHYINETEADRYVRNGSVAVNWEAADGDREFSWKAL
jgi:hypothetical protein